MLLINLCCREQSVESDRLQAVFQESTWCFVSVVYIMYMCSMSICLLAFDCTCFNYHRGMAGLSS